LQWQRIHWQRPLDAERATGLLRLWAADQRSPRIVLEARASRSGVIYLVGTPGSESVATTVTQHVPGSRLTPAGLGARRAVTVAARLKATTRHRALRSDKPEPVVRAVLSALAHVRGEERLVLQVVLGPRRVPLAIPTQSPSSIVQPWWHVAYYGNGKTVDSEKRTALRAKVSDHGFACTIRFGVTAKTPERRRALLLGLMAAIRTSELAGVQLQLVRVSARRLNQAAKPTVRWPLRFNVQELAGHHCIPSGCHQQTAPPL
jgi:hypothetical protein